MLVFMVSRPWCPICSHTVFIFPHDFGVTSPHVPEFIKIKHFSQWVPPPLTPPPPHAFSYLVTVWSMELPCYPKTRKPPASPPIEILPLGIPHLRIGPVWNLELHRISLVPSTFKERLRPAVGLLFPLTQHFLVLAVVLSHVEKLATGRGGGGGDHSRSHIIPNPPLLYWMLLDITYRGRGALP